MNMSSDPHTSARPVLIFPAGMPRSIEYLRSCIAQGQAVIGSSSVMHDPSRPQYPQWLHLPYVTDASFESALAMAIAQHGIGGVYTPNPVVWSHLEKLLPRIAPGVQLVNEWPVNQELSPYRAALQRARAALAAPLSLPGAATGKPPMSEVEMAALFRHADTIPGQCDHEKIAALAQAATRCGEGDVVEVGVLWGKSAFVLARLSAYHGIGAVLCVDPWQTRYLAQHDERGLVDSVHQQWDTDEARVIFEMNLLPYAAGQVNYLRLPSTQAQHHYAAHRSATTAAFGTTHYCGSIALLHIDGNHSFEAVSADVDAWCPHVKPGGWIVIDDYRWPYGDGPRRAGDAYIQARCGDVSAAFVIGGALFIQRAH